jgi:hypothetical protein
VADTAVAGVDDEAPVAAAAVVEVDPGVVMAVVDKFRTDHVIFVVTIDVIIDW